MSDKLTWIGRKSLFALRLGLIVLAATALLPGSARTQASPGEGPFRVGERLTYTVDFEKFSNVAYAELYTVSRGKIGEVEAIELRGRAKTLNFVSAAFYLVDETRNIFVSPDGVPIYITRIRNVGGLPRETIQNNLKTPTGNFDLVTMIYRIRQSEGSGSFSISENERTYPLTFTTTGSEKVKTDAGEFDSTLITVQCEYFTEIGLKDFRINLSTDEAKVPVAVRFRTAKGEFRAKVASIQNVEQQGEPTPTPILTPAATPKPIATPTPTPKAYVDNQPLLPELSFSLGETLEYRVSAGGEQVGAFTLQAAERKEVQGFDSLILSATATDAVGGMFAKGDSIKAVVNPATLAPRKLDISMTGSLATLNQSVMFDERTNTIMFKGTGQIEAPVGTHSILSLVYAIRSFNLKPSKDTSNPINDTRVAVFWENRPYIFTLRPSNAELMSWRGEKISAQLVSITTENPILDAQNIKIWLSNDERRVPIKFQIGRYSAELVSEKIISPK